MVKGLMFFVLVLICGSAQGQADSTRINTLLEQGEDSVDVNPKVAMQLLDEAYKASLKSGYMKGAFLALTLKGSIYEHGNDMPGALKYYKESLDYGIKNKLTPGVSSALMNIGRIYNNTGTYDKAIEHFIAAIKLKEVLKDSLYVAKGYDLIASSYYDRQEYNKVIFYSKKALEIYLKKKHVSGTVESLMALALANIEQKKYDNAYTYLSKARDLFQGNDRNFRDQEASLYTNLGLYFDNKGNKDSALHYYQMSLAAAKKIGSNAAITIVLSNLGQLMLTMHNTSAAEAYLKEALGMAKDLSAFTDIYGAARNLAELYKEKGDYKNALSYQEIASAAKDSVTNEEKTRIAEELDAKYRTKEIADKNSVLQRDYDLQSLRLQQKNIFLYGAIVGVLLLVVMAILLLRQNKLLRSQQRIELAHKQLYAQMNPHFIFNCLSSIQHFIINNDIRNANKYLTNFASLMRQTLQNSKTSTITLREEMKYLNSYLAMEHLRFENKFTYSIDCEDDIDTDAIELPPMMVQPFAENAIKHGLAYYEHNEGQLSIRFYKKNADLYCEIDDNGIGREQSQQLKEKINPVYTSQGMIVTKERMELASKIQKAQYGIEITDKREAGKATGTLVKLKFPIPV